MDIARLGGWRPQGTWETGAHWSQLEEAWRGSAALPVHFSAGTWQGAWTAQERRSHPALQCTAGWPGESLNVCLLLSLYYLHIAAVCREHLGCFLFWGICSKCTKWAYSDSRFLEASLIQTEDKIMLAEHSDWSVMCCAYANQLTSFGLL